MVKDTGVNPDACDFSVSGEYKEEPVPSVGNYRAILTGAKFNEDKYTINWEFTLRENGGNCVQMNSTGNFEDTEIPVDGVKIFMNTNLPVASDKAKTTKSGKPLYQWKLNHLGDLGKALHIQLESPKIIKESIQEGLYNDIPVTLELKLEEYEGRKIMKVNPFKVKRVMELD